MTKARKLVVLRYSPWSERARWALDHHAVPYELVQHEPFLGEPRLRRLVGNRTKRPTVPVLITEEAVLTDSWDIARYADGLGAHAKLFPADRAAEIRELASVADEAMASGRMLVVHSLLASNAALDEALPAFIPTFLRPLFRPFARYGTAWFGRKYGVNLADTETPRGVLRAALETFRQRLGGRAYVLGSFSYADIVLCSLLQGIRPPETEHVRLRPATRAAWTQHDLAREFEDLLTWRDALYRTQRPARAT
jgi:glutathione S-transferase